LRILDVAPDRVTVPALAAVYRAPLGGTDFSVFFHGRSGDGKSELAALMQRHFGAAMDRKNLPGNWLSTGNSIEGLAFKAKDTILVLDDFVPTGGIQEVQKSHAQAERVFRAQGNQSSRQRMRSDGSLIPAKPSRALIVATGEDVPRGQSLGARLLLVETTPTDMNWNKLTECQADATDGRYAAAMAGYVEWLSGQYDDVRRRLDKAVETFRDEIATSGGHRRNPQKLAELAVGL
jgi:hypothetical protein